MMTGQVDSMVPDEEPQAPSEQGQPAPRGPRRSRRGGRRPSRRRAPRPPGGPRESAESPPAPETDEPLGETAEAPAPVRETARETERASGAEPASNQSAVSQAIEQVTQIIEDL